MARSRAVIACGKCARGVLLVDASAKVAACKCGRPSTRHACEACTAKRDDGFKRSGADAKQDREGTPSPRDGVREDGEQPGREHRGRDSRRVGDGGELRREGNLVMMLGNKIAPYIALNLRKTLSRIERNEPLPAKLATLEAVATLGELGLVTVERTPSGGIAGAWIPARCQIQELVTGIPCPDSMAAPLRALVLGVTPTPGKGEALAVTPLRACVLCVKKTFKVGKLIRAWPVAAWLLPLDKKLCRRCGKVVAYPGADYCGNACQERDKGDKTCRNG